MKVGLNFWLLGELYEVVAKRGEFLTARKHSDGKLYWILECDIP
jgi:hypothetical protein